MLLLLDINTAIRVVLTVLQKLRTFAQASCRRGRRECQYVSFL